MINPSEVNNLSNWVEKRFVKIRARIRQPKTVGVLFVSLKIAK